MLFTRLHIRALGVIVAAGLSLPSLSHAQASDADKPSATSKAQTKAERRAARLAARKKNHEELQSLEKNGYRPADGQLNYPDALQGAQSRRDSNTPAQQPPHD